MDTLKIETSFSVYKNSTELPSNIFHLMQRAHEARKNAYAPYSHFQVGAAVLLENNEIVIGSNQENAAFPSGLCAERTAIFAAGALYPKIPIVALAISASPENRISNQPISPCGACRQSLLEYEVHQQLPFPIYFMGGEGEVIQVPSVQSLLPFAFTAF